ncbi:MAG TPA: hypothetical protein VF794_13500, partial [Archangium sp.]|uniref:GIY-YIG nuclease family protein n=1 Tax=Archangium sp. TaxID=1872627 RepID=UPI002ED80B4D
MSRWLLKPDELWSWPELRSQQALPRSPGVYGWYFKGLSKHVPLSTCHKHDGWSLAYVGIAASRPRAERVKSIQTLHKRIGVHFTGNACGSTLRLSLGCLLASKLGIELRRVGSSGTRLTFDLNAGEQKLSAWMVEHARVVFIEHPRPRELEEELIRELDLPLNLESNDQHPFHETLSKLRA